MSLESKMVHVANNDPFKLKLNFYTAHGNHHINIPVLSQIDGNLWMGGNYYQGLKLPKQFQHSVTVDSMETYRIFHNAKSRMIYDLQDFDGQDMSMITSLAHWVNSCAADDQTLVNCQAGLNRSGVIVARALMLRGMTADEAISLLREKRSVAVLCNPAFEKWLRDQDG